MSAALPHMAQRRILVATLGVFPQIVTETLYALATEAPAFVANEIHVITTTRGAAPARAHLLGPNSKIAALARSYELPDLVNAFSEDRLHVIQGADGRLLDDIDHESDNAACADFLNDLLRDLTSDPNSALHVSIAGGRKTMGFLLGYAFSLYGRQQDELSHILVDEPFQTHPEFFFPPRDGQSLRLRDGTEIDARRAKLSLARIPVVRLRTGLPINMLEGKATYTETVKEAQALLDPRELVVDFAAGALFCQGRKVELPPAVLGFAAWLARRAARMPAEEAALHYTEADPKEYNAEYELARMARPDLAGQPMTRPTGDVEKDWWDMTLSRLRGGIRESLGPLAARYEPRAFTPKPRTRTGFDLPSEAIRFR